MRRSVNFNVDASGKVDKRIPQFGGVRGEHHATEIVFTMAATAPYREGDLVRLRFTCGDGAVLSSDLVEDAIVQGERMLVSYSLPSVLTQAGGQLGVRVVFSRVDEDGRETETFLTDEAVLYFEDSASENGTPFWTGVSEMLKRTATASDAAVAARDAAIAQKHETQASAESASRFADAAEERALEAVSAEKNAQLYASAALSHRDDAEHASYNARTGATMAAHSAGVAKEAANRAEAALDSKLERTGHKPHKLLGTDGKGTVVTLDAVEYIPDYWESHLAEKIAAVQAAQDEGGKDCFSFVVMTDLHYPSNLGKNAPLLAKRIIEECAVKYALCLGDTQTRGCHATEAALLAENEQIKAMLAPLDGRLLRTQGNHDGNYGTKDGVNYVYRLPPSKLYGDIYRPVGLVGDAHFDESGSGYYIDDATAKVRYIVLNTHNTAYELNDDGTQKHKNQSLFRFGQSQYDLVVEALNSVPNDTWAVVVCGHVPITTGYAENWGGTGGHADGDSKTMRELLTAYANKTTYSREWAGTAGGGASYTDLADENSADWLDDKRFNSSWAVTDAPGVDITNFIPLDGVANLHLKGLDIFSALSGGANYGRMYFYDSDKHQISYYQPSSAEQRFFATAAYDDSVKIVSIADFVEYYTDLRGNAAYIRFGGIPTETDVIITADQNIEAVAQSYDAVKVHADFTAAKGEMVGYFSGHMHADYVYSARDYGVNIVTSRCDAAEENDISLKAEREANSITEQSFDVVTVNKATRTVSITKIGAGDDRILAY